MSPTRTERHVRPTVIWFTGLSGAGKTTLATAVERELLARGVRTECLDGDAVRALSPAGFSRAERDAHVRRVGFLASRLEHHGVTVLCALISPYQDAREQVRSLCARFLEVYVATPLAICEGRDVKGLYAKARRRELSGFTGIDDPYEPPTRADLILDTTELSIADAVQRVMDVWEKQTESCGRERSRPSHLRQRSPMAEHQVDLGQPRTDALR